MKSITTLRHLAVGLTAIAGCSIAVVALFARVTGAVATRFVGRAVRRTAVARIGIAIVADLPKSQFTIAANHRPTRAKIAAASYYPRHVGSTCCPVGFFQA